MASQFGSLVASELYCPRCRRAQRVRERLLLILPDGELHDYLCSGCGSSLGQRKVSGPRVAVPGSPPPRAAARRLPPNPASPPRPPRGLLR